MIAFAAPTDAQVQKEFCEMLPEMTGRIRHYLLAYRRELRDELTTEAVALAWQAFRSARSKDKDVQPSTLAWYCARAVRSGRKLAGSSTTDATSMRAQKEQGRAKSLDIDPTIYDLLVDRRWRWPLIDVCGTRLDWDCFRGSCSAREKKLLDLRAKGEMQTDIAEALGVTPARVCQRLGELRDRWRVYAA